MILLIFKWYKVNTNQTNPYDDPRPEEQTDHQVQADLISEPVKGVTKNIQAPPSPTFLKSILSLKSRFWPQIPHLILKSPSPHKFEDSSRYNFEEILKYLRVNKNIP